MLCSPTQLFVLHRPHRPTRMADANGEVMFQPNLGYSPIRSKAISSGYGKQTAAPPARQVDREWYASVSRFPLRDAPS
jgi:hypothetical protein